MVYIWPKRPLTVGSSEGTSWFRPHRGSRAMLMFGDQQSRPACGWPLHGIASRAPCSQSERSSRPMAEPMSRQSEALKVAPSEFGLGKDVGHLGSSPTRPHVVWTPGKARVAQEGGGNNNGREAVSHRDILVVNAEKHQHAP
eukprot:scaffold7963_cov116-Isochrysis_galbana.AAC.10